MDRQRMKAGTAHDWPWAGMTARDVTAAWSEWANDLADAFDSVVEAVAPRERKRRHRPQRSYRGECRERCAHDSCHCACCIDDADLVVYGRFGEQRVVPIRISNERTREAVITLDLSEFRSGGGAEAPVRGSILTATEFSLQGCEDEETIIILTFMPERDVDSIREMAKVPPKSPADRDPARFPDVDDCIVAYADLRIQGCNVRPVRIAAAVLPRDCDRYDVHCSCGCC